MQKGRRDPKQGMGKRLGIILLLGALGGLAVGAFSDYVASIDDSPQGATPLSWMFKSRTGKIPEFFAAATSDSGRREKTMIPQLDQVAPERTDLALFALG